MFRLSDQRSDEAGSYQAWNKHSRIQKGAPVTHKAVNLSSCIRRGNSERIRCDLETQESSTTLFVNAMKTRTTATTTTTSKLTSKSHNQVCILYHINWLGSCREQRGIDEKNQPSTGCPLDLADTIVHLVIAIKFSFSVALRRITASLQFFSVEFSASCHLSPLHPPARLGIRRCGESPEVHDY